MQKFKTFLTVIGAVTILVLAANSAVYAATGGKFILGKTNKASAVSTLKRTTGGSALKLTTTSSSVAPLVVNGKGKVANLNADIVDGYDGSQVLNKALVYERALSISSAVSSFTVTLTNVPAGKYLFSSDGFIYTSPSTNAHACHLTVPSTSRDIYEWFPADASGGFVMPNGSGFVTVPTTQNLTYTCYDNSFVSNTWETLSSQPLQLILTPVASVGTGSTSLARIAPSGRALTR